MFIVSEPTFPRLKSEKFFRALYALGVVINFAALVITLANYVYRLNQTYSQFSGSSAVLDGNLTILLAGCNFTNKEFSVGPLGVQTTLDLQSSKSIFLSHTYIIVGVIIVMFFIFINDIISKGCFVANIRNSRIRGITIPVNTISANAMLVQSIALLILIGASSAGRSFLNSYVRECTQQFADNHFDEFIARENNVQNVWGTNLSLIVIAVAINLGIYLAAFIALCVDGWSDAAAEFENRKYFWEESPWCLPNKKELFHYSKWRRFALEMIEKGHPVQLMPVSYLEFMQDLEDAKSQMKMNGDDTFESFYPNDDDENQNFIPGGRQQQQQEGDEEENAASPKKSGVRVNVAPLSFTSKQQQQAQHQYFQNFGRENSSAAQQQQQQQQQQGGLFGNSSGLDVAPEQLMEPEEFDPDEDYENHNVFYGLSSGGGGGDDNNYGEGDSYEPKSATAGQEDQFYPPSSHRQDEQQGFGGYYSRAASGATASAMSPNNQNQMMSDRPYYNNTSSSNIPSHLQKHVGESEAEKKERHRLRRVQETPDQRQMRKERKRRVRELALMQQQQEQQGENNNSGKNQNYYATTTTTSSQQQNTGRSVSGKPIPAPLPSP